MSAMKVINMLYLKIGSDDGGIGGDVGDIGLSPIFEIILNGGKKT
jgi:hypothetical protein